MTVEYVRMVGVQYSFEPRIHSYKTESTLIINLRVAIVFFTNVRCKWGKKNTPNSTKNIFRTTEPI